MLAEGRRAEERAGRAVSGNVARVPTTSAPLPCPEYTVGVADRAGRSLAKSRSGEDDELAQQPGEAEVETATRNGSTPRQSPNATGPPLSHLSPLEDPQVLTTIMLIIYEKNILIQ